MKETNLRKVVVVLITMTMRGVPKMLAMLISVFNEDDGGRADNDDDGMCQRYWRC